MYMLHRIPSLSRSRIFFQHHSLLVMIVGQLVRRAYLQMPTFLASDFTALGVPAAHHEQLLCAITCLHNFSDIRKRPSGSSKSPERSHNTNDFVWASSVAVFTLYIDLFPRPRHRLTILWQ